MDVWYLLMGIMNLFAKSGNGNPVLNEMLLHIERKKSVLIQFIRVSML